MYWLMLLPSYCGRSYCQDCGRCYCYNGVVDYITTCDIMKVSITLADVIANLYCGRSYCLIFCGGCCYHFFLLIAYFVRWQMLLALYVVDGKPQMFIYDVGRCYCHGGRWNNHPGWVLFGRCNSHGSRWNYHWSTLFQL